MIEQASAGDRRATGWRFRLGTALFLLSMFGPFLFIPLVARMGFPTELTAAISGGILVGGELVLVLATAVMGKAGFAYLKARVFGLLKQYGPPMEVSRLRYLIGLVLFVVPILSGWLAPYASHLIPGYAGNELTFAVVGDVILVVSLFVLGGEFWEKIRALFIHGARAIIPEKRAADQAV
jgi:hypothetical protein